MPTLVGSGPRVGVEALQRTKHSAWMDFAQKDQKSIRTNPRPFRFSAGAGILHSDLAIRALGHAGCYAGTQAYSLFTMS